MKIVFLDVDGVLLSGKAWLLPGNATAKAAALAKGGTRQEAALQAHFDPCAVSLINRLCEVTAAQLVVHSNWRHNVGVAETRGKLLEQGIEERHLHADWYTPTRRSFREPSKTYDINDWLEEHRLTPAPERPGNRLRASQESLEAYEQAKFDFGITALVIDDEYLDPNFSHLHRLAIDSMDGFTVADYVIACGFFQVADKFLAVHPVVDADWERVLGAFHGDRLEAARWLHGRTDCPQTRARRLDIDDGRREWEALAAWGYGGGDFDAHAAERRENVWAELDRLVAERDAEFSAAEKARQSWSPEDF